MLLTDGARRAAFGEPRLILSIKPPPQKNTKLKKAKKATGLQEVLELEGHMCVIIFAYIC